MTKDRQPITESERNLLLESMRKNSWSTTQAAAESESVIGRAVSQSTIARWVDARREEGDLEALPAHLRSKRGRHALSRQHGAGLSVEDLLGIPAVMAVLRGEAKTLTDAAKEDVLRVDAERAAAEAAGSTWDGQPAVSQPSLSRYLDRLSENLDEVVARLGYTPQALQGRASRPTKGSKTVHTYPVYGKVRAGLTGQTLVAEPAEWADRSYYTDRDLRAGDAGAPFALQVVGDSMTDDRASTHFPEGAVVLVNPNREAVSGDFVVAIDRTDGSTTFKRLRRTGQGLYLVPLNEAYPPVPLNDDLFVAGVVEEAMLPCYSRR